MNTTDASSPDANPRLYTNESSNPSVEERSLGPIERNVTLEPQVVKRKPLSNQSLSSNAPLRLLTDHNTDRSVETSHSGLASSRVSDNVNQVGGARGQDDAHASEPTQTETHHSDGRRDWLPDTLKWPYLVGLFTISLLLLAVIIYLQVYSRNHLGLGNDDDSSALLFGWRFVPTLIATIYALLCTMLLEDVKRTEPYARLANSRGAPAKATVLQESGAWWNALADGLSRKKNFGHRSWPLTLSAICMILAVIVISPLSSSLLLPFDVAFNNPVTFQRIEISQSAPVRFGDQIVPRFRTIGHLLQNITTSAWVTDDFVVLPFWPTSLSTAPFATSMGISPETWTAETTVFKSQLECKALNLLSREVVNITTDLGGGINTTEMYSAVTLGTTDDCIYQFALRNSTDFARYGGSSWASPKLLAVNATSSDLPGPANQYSETGQQVQLNYTKQCSGDEVLVVSTPWIEEDEKTWISNLKVAGQICTAHYYAANVAVSLNLTESDSFISFDENDFMDNRKYVDTDALDVTLFQGLFLTLNWSYHFIKPQESNPRSTIGGPAALIAAIYNFSMYDAANDIHLVDEASRTKQRYFGEALITSLSERTTQANDKVEGEIVSVRTRIVVAQAVAYTLEALFATEILLVFGLFWITGCKRRALGVETDPAKSTVTARFISGDNTARFNFQNLSNCSSKQMKTELQGTKFWIANHRLYAIDGAEQIESEHKQVDPRSSKKRESQDWRPLILKRWVIAGLGFSLLAILVAIAVLYTFSLSSKLYQKALIYQTQIVISGAQLSTFAPYSIIPTALAVGIGLWWNSMESDFRLVQPYVGMAKRPVTFSNGVNLSYQSSYLIWAAIKAGFHRHWLLSLVCVGAFLSQVFIIAMSALWQEEYGHRTLSMTLPRNLELRTVPWMFATPSIDHDEYEEVDISQATILANLYGSLETNWLYSAIIQLTFNSTDLPWSSEGWSFVPVDLSSLDHMNNEQDLLHAESSRVSIMPNVLVTITTPALRAKVECSAYEVLSNVSNWVTHWDLTNSTNWNVTTDPEYPTSGYTLGYESPFFSADMGLTPDGPDYAMQTPILVVSSPAVQCCENKTAGSNDGATIAHWTPNRLKSGQTQNFTVKWIYGHPVAGFQPANMYYQPYAMWPQDTIMMWPEVPQMAALNCVPIIQKTNATVTIDHSSGRVQSYTILDKMITDEGALEYIFDEHYLPGPRNNTNTTASYGSLFLSALLRAADLTNLADMATNTGSTPETIPNENVRDLTYNFKSRGLNMDYPSYAMYSLVNQDPQTLLDHQTLYHFANRTFSTFFQHYVSANLSVKDGGWAYQKIGTQLPPYIGDPKETDLQPVSYTSHTVEVQVTERVKMLHMSPVAAWLSMIILLWLILTAVLILLLEKRHLASLQQGVKTIADVAVLVAGSHAFLGHVRNSSNNSGLKTKLGWFRDRDGNERWGIEIFGPESGVEWLDNRNKDNDESEEASKGSQDDGGPRAPLNKVGPVSRLIETRETATE